MTKNDQGSMVLMSLEAYSKLTEGVEAALDKAGRIAESSEIRMTMMRCLGKYGKNDSGVLLHFPSTANNN